jgi:hypothetical protein
MFSRPEIKKLQKHKSKLEEIDYKGASRRAVSLMPGPSTKDPQDIALSDQTKFRQLLLSIEANQSSCCIKVTSPRNKSRAAILIFRGRAIGCIYGNKRLERQLFGQEAYGCILADITHQNNTIDAYLLSEDLVLAAASLFNGDVYTAKGDQSPEEVFESAHRGLVNSGMPGSIVVKQPDGLPAVIVYIFGGKIVGVFSHKEGWVSTAYEKAWQYLVSTPKARVSASMLTANNTDEVFALSFSLSGINEYKSSSATRFSEYDLSYAMVANYDRKKALQMTTPFTVANPFMSKIKNPTVHNSRSIMSK